MGPFALMASHETAYGPTDVNGDGDADDVVLQLYDGESVVTLGASEYYDSPPAAVAGTWVLYELGERREGDRDLNADGDASDHVLVARNLSTGESMETGLAGRVSSRNQLSDLRFAFTASEEESGTTDLNGDGDALDDVVHVFDLESGSIVNLGLAATDVLISDRWLVVNTVEESQGRDLDGDGLVGGNVLCIRDLRSNAAWECIRGLQFQSARIVSERWLTADLQESKLGEDRNGDGNEDDSFLHLLDLERGGVTDLGESRYVDLSERWLLFAENRDLLARHLETGREFDLEAAGFEQAGTHGDTLWFTIGENSAALDLNTDGDLEDRFLRLADLGPLVSGNSFLRGDDNGDGTIDQSDPVYSLEFQFLGLGEPGCLAALDTNADGVLDISDPIYNLEHQFLGKPAPPAPYPDCGPESLPPEEALPCGTPPVSCP